MFIVISIMMLSLSSCGMGSEASPIIAETATNNIDTETSTAIGKKANSKLIVGTLTAYYAKKKFGDYEVGDLIVDTNDPVNRMVSVNSTEYKYEGDDTDVYYSSKIPKAYVEMKQYTMYHLPISEIEDGLVFRSKSGNIAHIFRSKNNGHKFCDCVGEPLRQSVTNCFNECFVLKVVFYTQWSDEVAVIEEQLATEDGHLKLYTENPYGNTGVRKKKHPIGLIVEEWVNPEDYGEMKSAYDAKGRLMVDQWENCILPNCYSVAFLAEENALYFMGELYFRESAN